MSPKRTHLYEFHKKYGKLTVFAGFEHALWYEGIIPEHLAVREAAGLFDVTHMGRCLIEGEDAVAFLNYVITRDVSTMNIKQGRYSVMLNERGGIIDDLTVFKLGENKFLMVYNASNREKDFNWLKKHSANYNVKLTNVSDEVVMLALQGPKAIDILQSIADKDLRSVKRYWLEWFKVDGLEVMATRSGYTGEDGFEIYLWNTPLSESERALKLWNMILEAGKPYGIKPCGLGARDTLRLEAGMCLYDHDISEDITPLEAGLDWVVSFEKGEFIGKEALLKQKEEGIKRRRVGLRIIEKGIPREHCKIYKNGEEIGFVTSGTFSPLLKYGIGMGYVKTEYSEVGTKVEVDIRGRRFKAEIVSMPFYDTTRYGWRRKEK